jgi:hypothetical protein
MKPLSLIVEGLEDIRFLQDFVDYHFSQPLARMDFIEIGGKSDKLHKSQAKIQESTSQGNVNLLVFDADDSDFATTKNKIQVAANSLNLNFDSIFLFPNNQDAGNLETLLKKCIPTDKSAVVNCIESYKKCVAGLTDLGLKPVDDKKMLYIYQEAFGPDKGSFKGSARTYLREDIWNLNAAATQPLRQFLAPFFSDSNG